MRATEAPAVCGACVPQPFWGQTKQPALTSLCKGSQRIGAGGGRRMEGAPQPHPEFLD